MGWSGGSELMDELIGCLKHEGVSDKSRSFIYANMIHAFENLDCDTLDECLDRDPIFDKIYEEINPYDPYDE